MADTPDRFVGFHIESDPDTTRIVSPDKGEAQPSATFPLRLLFMSDLTPDAPVPDWSGPSLLHAVDRQRFSALMEALAPRLALEVPDHISASKALLEFTLSFPTLAAFHPEGLAGQLPPLAQLLTIRTLIDLVRRKEIDLPTFRSRLSDTGVDADWAERLFQTLQKPAAPPSQQPSSKPSAFQPSGVASLDRLLGMIDVGQTPAGTDTPPAPGSAGFVDALIQAVAGASPDETRVENTAADQLLMDLDQVLGEQLNALLAIPRLRSLEASWRGLKLLVDRIPFKANIQLDVLAAPKAELDNALYHQVLLPTFQAKEAPTGYAAIILDFAFDQRSKDMALLAELAETAASLQVPLIGAVDASFFGLAAQQELDRLPVLWQMLDTPTYIEWHKLRADDHAQSLALALPDFLLRAPYGKDNPVKAFPFEEQGRLWGHASLAVALRIADSFSRTGWPTNLLGSAEQVIPDLPIWTTRKGATPLAALLSDQQFAECKKAGFTVLGGRSNRDSLYVARAVMVHASKVFDDLLMTAEAREHDTLACQLFVAEAARFVVAVQQSLVPQDDMEQARAEIEARMRAFLANGGRTVPQEAVWVEQMENTGNPDVETFGIRLRPPSHILDRGISLVLGIQVTRKPAA